MTLRIKSTLVGTAKAAYESGGKTNNVTLHEHPTIKNLCVTEEGEVFKRMPFRKDSNGYSTVAVSCGSAQRTVRRSILILETFAGPRPEGCVARHLNGDPSDDHSTNLAWGTQSQNMKDAISHGTTTKGTKNAHAKLTEMQVFEIRQRFKDGESGSAIAEEFAISHSTVCDLVAGRTWAWLK